MTYILLCSAVWFVFAFFINKYFTSNGTPAFFKTRLFRVFIAGLLIVLNALDWWLTKHIIAEANSTYESNIFIRFLVEQSPFAGEFHKLVTGSIIVGLLSFAFHLDALLAFVFLLAAILIINGVTLSILIL